MQQGGDEHWGYYIGVDRNYYVLANIYDAVNTNTAATGFFKKAPKFERWPTPAIAVERLKRKPRTTRELYMSLGGLPGEGGLQYH